MKTTLKYFSLLSLASTLLLTSCGSNADKNACSSSQNLTVNIEGDPNTLDGRKARTTTDYTLICTFNEGLFRTDAQGKISPAIADSYTISKDGTHYEITLKETLWSNGDPVTAHNFIDSWKSSVRKGFPSPNLSFLYSIKNARNIKKGSLPLSMLGARAEGDYKIIIDLESPVPFFLELLAQTVFFPTHPLNEEGINIANNTSEYICNGPFILDSWKAANHIIAKKNPNYWDSKNVKLQTLTMLMLDQEAAYNMYENKEIDVVGSPLSSIPLDHLINVQERSDLKNNPFLCTYWLRTNTNKYPLNNKHFRKSLAYSINRKEIIDHIFHGKAEIATGIVPKTMELNNTPYFQDGDFEKAQDCLQIACKELSISKKKMPTITLLIGTNEKNRQVATVLQDTWRKELGINIEIEVLESKVFFDRVARQEYDLAWGAWTGDYNDPSNFLEVFKTKEVGTNNTGWESPDYIAAINQSYEQMEQESRKESFITAESIIMEELPVIPVIHTTMLYLQQEKVKNFVVHETGRVDFKWAYKEN